MRQPRAYAGCRCSSREDQVTARSAAVLSHARPRLAVAAHDQPISHPRFRNYVAANTSRSRDSEVPRVRSALSKPARACTGELCRRTAHVGRTGLQCSSASALAVRPHPGCPKARSSASHRGRAATAARRRPVYLGSGFMFRIRKSRSGCRHERAPGFGSSIVGARSRCARARPRLGSRCVTQSSSIRVVARLDGYRRALLQAQPELRGVPGVVSVRLPTAQDS